MWPIRKQGTPSSGAPSIARRTKSPRTLRSPSLQTSLVTESVASSAEPGVVVAEGVDLDEAAQPAVLLLAVVIRRRTVVTRSPVQLSQMTRLLRRLQRRRQQRPVSMDNLRSQTKQQRTLTRAMLRKSQLGTQARLLRGEVTLPLLLTAIQPQPLHPNLLLQPLK